MGITDENAVTIELKDLYLKSRQIETNEKTYAYQQSYRHFGGQKLFQNARNKIQYNYVSDL